MTRSIWVWAVLAAMTVGGCVVSYDPAAPRFGIRGEPPAPQPAPAPAPPPTVATRPAGKPSPAPAAAPPSAEAAAPAIPDTPVGRQLEWIVSVLNGQEPKKLETHFTPEFLQKVSAAEFRKIVRQWRRDELAGGTAELAKISEATETSTVALVRGRLTDRYTQVRLAVDDSGKMHTLWLAPVLGIPSAATSWDAFDDKLAALPGDVSMAACRFEPGSGDAPGQWREIHAFGADRRLAIGSTAKLYILGALAEMIAAAEISWNEIVTIDDQFKSLPSGRMQLLPEGTEVTVREMVEAMVSLSDNTAADHLLHRIGRERVEEYMRRLNGDPQRSLPFLRTMELFKLRLATDRELGKRYAAADIDQRREMLAPGGAVEEATINAEALLMWKWPYMIEQIEWFATGPECCALAADIRRLEQLPGMEPLARAMRINPGLQFDPSTWTSVGYKGGSEPGVLNMTWVLQRADGRWYTLSLGWNNPKKPLDLRSMSEMAGAAASILAQDK